MPCCVVPISLRCCMARGPPGPLGPHASGSSVTEAGAGAVFFVPLCRVSWMTVGGPAAVLWMQGPTHTACHRRRTEQWSTCCKAYAGHRPNTAAPAAVGMTCAVGEGSQGGLHGIV
jgi:hypothetical protein